MRDALLHDVRFAARALARSPLTTAVAILTMALGVGANTAVLSVFESVLLNPLPYANADRLISVTNPQATRVSGIPARVAYDWREHSGAVDAIGLYTDSQLVLTGDGEPDVFRGQRVNAEFFDTLGVRPLLGRVFTPDDDRPPAPAVVVLSYELWSTRFGSDATVVGRLLTLNGTPDRVIGVLARTFQPLRMSNPAEEPRIFAPLGCGRVNGRDRGNCGAPGTVARLAPGVSVQRARDALMTTTERLHEEYPNEIDIDPGIRVAPLKDQMTGALTPALSIALAAAACVLLIACANLANLQLARAAARGGEFALRGALGSSRARLAGGMLIETLLVAAAGCAAGLVLGRLGVDALVALAPRELPRLGEIGLDTRVLLASAAIGIMTAAAAGVVPAWLAARADVNDALKHLGDRASAGRGRRARAALVVCEVAAAFVLVTGTGLLIRTVSQLLSLDAGFDARGVLTMTPVVTGPAGMTPPAMLLEKQRMVDAVAALPGVTAAAMVNEVPLSHTTPVEYAIEGRAAAPGEAEPTANVFWIDGDFFPAMGIALRRGRALTRHDGSDAPPAAVVSESFARRHFPGADPLGSRIHMYLPLGNKAWLTIVGVAADVKNVGLDRPGDEAVYEPLAMNPGHYIRIVARTGGDPSQLERPIRSAVRQIDPLVPIFHVQPLQDYVASSMAARRFALALMTAFGTLALALAVVGLYGVLSYTVVVRTPELGIRAALGATSRHLLALVVGEAFALIAIGVLLGSAAALVSTRQLASLLFAVSPMDATTYAATAALLLGVGLAACALPARRAARVDPLRALRST